MNNFPNVNDMPDLLGYGQRPRGFTALLLALSRLGFPGGAGLGYPMAAAGPTATMGPSFSPYDMGYGPQMMGYNPQMMGFNPQMMGYNPQMMGYNPQMMGYGQDAAQLQNQYLAAMQAQALSQQLMQGQAAAAAVPGAGVTYGQ